MTLSILICLFFSLLLFAFNHLHYICTECVELCIIASQEKERVRVPRSVERCPDCSFPFHLAGVKVARKTCRPGHIARRRASTAALSNFPPFSRTGSPLVRSALLPYFAFRKAVGCLASPCFLLCFVFSCVLLPCVLLSCVFLYFVALPCFFFPCLVFSFLSCVLLSLMFFCLMFSCASSPDDVQYSLPIVVSDISHVHSTRYCPILRHYWKRTASYI